MKKLLLGLGTTAAIAMPITAVVACSFGSDDDNKNEIHTTGTNGAGKYTYKNQSEFQQKVEQSTLSEAEKNKILGELASLPQSASKARTKLVEIVNKYADEVEKAQPTGLQPQAQAQTPGQNGPVNSMAGYTKSGLTQQQFMSPLQYQKLAAIGRNKLINYSKFNVGNNTLDLIKELRAMRTHYGRGWEPMGDAVVDSINDARFITFQQYKGNDQPRLKFKEIVDSSSSMTFSLKDRDEQDPLKGHDNIETNKIAHSMSNFLNNGDLTAGGLAYAKDGMLNGHPHQAIHAWGNESDINNMKPVVPAMHDMAWAQYRANQIEYNGDISANGNPHDWSALNENIVNGRHSAGGSIAHAPTILTGPGCENLGNFVDTSIDGKLQNNNLSEITTIEAYSLMWGFFLDRDDATATVGHRGNMLMTSYRTVGWSEGITLNSENSNEYGIIGYYEFGADAPYDSKAPSSKLDLSWLDGEDGNNLALFVKNGLQYDKLPFDINTWTHKQILDVLNGVVHDEHFQIKDMKGNISPASAYGSLNLHDKGGSAAQKAFDAIHNSQIALGDVDSTVTPTHVYDILGSSTQAEYESK